MYVFKRVGLKLIPLIAACLTQLSLLLWLAEAQSQPLSTGQVSGSALALSFSYSAKKIEQAVNESVSVNESLTAEETMTTPDKEAHSENVFEKDVLEKDGFERDVLVANNRVEQAEEEPLKHPIVGIKSEMKSLEVESSVNEIAELTSKNEPSNTSISDLLAESIDDEKVVDQLLESLQEEDLVGQLAGVASDVSGAHQEIELEPSFYAPPEPPNYPRIARKRGQEGVVWLDIWLDRQGSQTRLEIYDSSGVALLDQAAMDAVSKWSFIPKKIAGLTMASRVRVPVHFELN